MNSEELAWKIRRHGIEMTHLSKGSHIASILSISEIVAVLYNDVMKIFPEDPSNDLRDRFILSKGHAGAAVYAALAEKGFFPVEQLNTHYSNGSKLSGHVSHKGVPGVEVSTGSLGHGIGIGIGMALAAKADKKNHRIFVLLGDGECNEGSVWEGIMFAAQYKLNNLTIIIDKNNMQGLGNSEDIIDLKNLKEKIEIFGWNVKEVNGHSCSELKDSLTKVSEVKPNCIIAKTVKGKGISFMEDNILWHYRDPQDEYYIRALEELERIRP